MRKLARLRMPRQLTTTESEYRANLAGMNTFFGAVLGFVIADVQTPSNWVFGTFLLLTAAVVISILYISASHQRWLYSLSTLLLIAFYPDIIPDSVRNAERLQATLFVWAAMSIALELYPRRPDPQSAGPTFHQ